MPRILFVCTANVCRSPFAAVTLSRSLAESGHLRDAIVESAGTLARPGDRVCNLAMLTLMPPDPGDEHRSRVVNRQMVESADLVLTAELTHRSAATRLSPRSHGRIFTMLEAAALAELIGGDGADSSGSTGAGSTGSGSTGAGSTGEGSSEGLSTDERFEDWVMSLNSARGLVMPSVATRRRGSSGASVANGFDIPDGHFARTGPHRKTLAAVEDAVDRLAGSMIRAVAPRA